MKVTLLYNIDVCKACFDNALYLLSDLKENGDISELYYRDTGLILFETKLTIDEIKTKLDSDPGIVHKYSKCEEEKEDRYRSFVENSTPYTKSLFSSNSK